jgi:hypothetical protein
MDENKTLVEFHPMMTKVECQEIILLPAYFEDKLVLYQIAHIQE